MQAVILAAGMGKRLGELTKENTKCMVKIHGITLIERLLNQIKNIGIDKVVLVIGYKGEKLQSHIGNNYKGINIQYIENETYDKTNNIYSLALAKEFLISDDTLLFESDLIFEDSVLHRIYSCSSPNAVAVAKYESWMDGTVVTLDEEDTILSFIPKIAFDFSEIERYYKTVNIYKLSKDFCTRYYVPFLDAYCKSMGNNQYYEEVLRVLTFIDRVKLTAVKIHNQQWYEIDDIQDLDIAETIFSRGEDKLNTYHKRYGGYWRFPQLLDFCYLVNPFFPPKRLVDEINVNFKTLMETYPSGMNVNRLLAAKFFGIRPEYTLVGNGAAELIALLMKDQKIMTGIMFPTFEEYSSRLPEECICSITPNDNSFNYTINDIEELMLKVNQIIIVNPNNPTGQLLPVKDLIELISKYSHVRIIVDESFIDFVEPDQRHTLLNNDIISNHHNLVVIKSISKSYGVPGFRLGVMATADKNLINSIYEKIPVWNINSFGEFFMQIFNKYEKDYDNACQLFCVERKRFLEDLQKIKFLRTIPTQANFILCEVITPFSSTMLAQELLDKYNILIKDCRFKKGIQGKSYIRIAIRNLQDNVKLFNALADIQQKKNNFV
ncbi:MAG TPA: aminotransferase class I/II-fold pyridoxal phosphate-dependent enzyme [Bacteroidales bacterium]|nr:aminotransferase class I/II-fold pyridoxal phosphate-dependent enzyme [Bacteroidales bacterium]